MTGVMNKMNEKPPKMRMVEELMGVEVELMV